MRLDMAMPVEFSSNTPKLDADAAKPGRAAPHGQLATEPMLPWTAVGDDIIPPFTPDYNSRNTCSRHHGMQRIRQSPNLAQDGPGSHLNGCGLDQQQPSELNALHDAER